MGDDLAAVQANREQLIAGVGGASGGTHVIGAAHSANVAILEQPGDGVTEGVDALVTTVPNLALVGLGADCAVITFADADNGVVGVAHSGWQGLVKGIIAATVGAMVDLGSKPESMRAVLGPSICGQCYEVDADRASQVEAVAPSAVFESAGRFGVDIALGATTLLAQSGVVATSSGVCTFESQRHFSYRRDGLTGRQGAVVILRTKNSR